MHGMVWNGLNGMEWNHRMNESNGIEWNGMVLNGLNGSSN